MDKDYDQKLPIKINEMFRLREGNIVGGFLACRTI
jgi:hypothetical protein